MGYRMIFCLILCFALFACEKEYNSLKSYKVANIDCIMYMHKTKVIYMECDSVRINKMYNSLFPAEKVNKIEFKSFNFVLVKLKDNSMIRIEVFENYYRLNGKVYRVNVDLHRLFDEYSDSINVK